MMGERERERGRERESESEREIKEQMGVAASPLAPCLPLLVIVPSVLAASLSNYLSIPVHWDGCNLV